MLHSPATMAVGDRNIACCSFGELVSNAVHSQNILRIPRIEFQLSPEILDVSINGAIERFDSNATNRVEELRPGKHPSGLACQSCE